MPTYGLGDPIQVAHGCCSTCTCAGVTCPGGYHCIETAETITCVPDCTVDADCPANHYCFESHCYPNDNFCIVDADCPRGRSLCLSGHCVQCTVDADCPANFVCASNECVPTIGCDPPCGDGEICNPCGAPSCMACGDIAPTLGLSAGDAGYDGAYDFDCNGRVDYQDFTYWRSQCG